MEKVVQTKKNTERKATFIKGLITATKKIAILKNNQIIKRREII